MFGPISRALLRKAPAVRLQSAVVRRGMATEPMELPRLPGTVCVLGSIGMLTAVCAWVNYNDLIVWGFAPPRPKAD